MYLITRISSRIQDERGFDIAGMVNGLLPAVPGLITSIANAAKGGVSDIVPDKMLSGLYPVNWSNAIYLVKRGY